MPPAGDGFRRQATRKGTIKLKTLRKPGVKDISSMFNKAGQIDDEKLGFADEAGLESLLALLDHEHPKIRALAEETISNLRSEEGEIVVVDQGFKPCAELLRYKNHAAQRDTLWTLATLAGNTEMNHEGIITDIGWNTILSRANSKLPDLQRPAVTLIANISMNEEHHDMIINEGGLELLKSLAGTDDIKLKRAVCNAFANLCADEENVQVVLGEGGLKMIIDFLDSGDDELIAGALHTIANVASADEVQQQIIELGGVPNIIKLMNSLNVMIQKGATTAIANLVANQEYQQSLIDSGLLDPLLFLARKSKNPEVQFRVTSALNNLAANGNLKQMLKDAGAVQPLKSLARSRDPEIKREAIEALAELGITYVSSKTAKKNEDESAVSEQRERERLERERVEEEKMREITQREAQERQAMEREIAQRERIERERAEVAARERVERESREREAQLERERERLARERQAIEEQRAREARESEERRLAMERELERSRRESQLLADRDRQEREALERQRAELERLRREQEAELEAQRRRQLEAMEQEARRAQEELDKLRREKEEMERAAREAAEREAAARAIGGSSGALKMVKMTEVIEIEEEKDVDEDYEEEDDELTDDDRREKAKIALAMVDLWETNEDISVTEAALRKLGALAMKERNRKLIRIAGAIPILCEFLRNADPSVGLTPDQSLALQVLAMLCRNVRNREEVRKNDGLRHCLRIVKVKEEKDLIEDLKALKELAKNDKNKVVLREGRLIESVVPMISPPNQIVQELVLDLLCIMSMNDVKSQVTVRDARGLTPIMKELWNEEVEIRRRAARTLGSVSQNNRKIQQEVRKTKNVIQRVVDMMREPNDEVKKAAAGACAALAENDYSNQIAIRKYDAITLLVNIMASDAREDVKEQAAAAVRSMAKGNTKIQQDFREGAANGIPALVHLLSANSIGLRIHVTGALMELARDNTKNCEIICKAGAVYPLVAALETENKVLQYMTEGCMWALARKSASRKRMFTEANAIEPLRILKMSDNPQVKKGAEWALEVLGA